MSVTWIGQSKNQKTLDVLSELTELANAGQLEGFAYVVSVSGDSQPKFGVQGAFYSDPWAGLSILSRLRIKLENLAARHELLPRRAQK